MPSIARQRGQQTLGYFTCNIVCEFYINVRSPHESNRELQMEK